MNIASGVRATEVRRPTGVNFHRIRSQRGFDAYKAISRLDDIVLKRGNHLAIFV
jgi:hypothetical protein